MLSVLSYNRGNFLRRAIRSLKEQTCPAWRAEVLDLGSTHLDTMRAIDECERADSRITVRRWTGETPPAEEAEYANPHLERVNKFALRGDGVAPLIYGSLADNAELCPLAVETILEWFAANPGCFSGYVTHERDIYSADGLHREGPASTSGHWDITPPIPGETFTHSVVGMLDHSQVFHRLPVLARWRTRAELGGDRRVDGYYFDELIRLHGPIYPISPGRVLTIEHLAWRVS